MSIELDGEKLLDRVERLATTAEAWRALGGSNRTRIDELEKALAATTASTIGPFTATAGGPPASPSIGPAAAVVLRKLAQASRDYPVNTGTAVWAFAVENNLDWSDIHALRAEMEQAEKGAGQ